MNRADLVRHAVFVELGPVEQQLLDTRDELVIPCEELRFHLKKFDWWLKVYRPSGSLALAFHSVTG